MDLKKTIAAIKERHAPSDNVYIAALRSGEMSRDDFVETQIQFLFAVVFFARPMGALVGRLPRRQMQLAILENLRDEHGSGRLTVCHENTFVELLQRLGTERAEIDRRALWPEVRAFNTTLLGLCALDDALTGVAALGMIEDMFAGISAAIGAAIVERGFLPKRDVVHYATHESLDVAHAEGFYAGLYEPYAEHPRHKYEIDQGLELGAYAFMSLYEGLYRARDRRWTREVKGPHSLADGWYLEPR
jgi:pyrroloquinoline-quinone synthase